MKLDYTNLGVGRDPSPVHQCDDGHSGNECNEQVETEVITDAFAEIILTPNRLQAIYMRACRPAH